MQGKVLQLPFLGCFVGGNCCKYCCTCTQGRGQIWRGVWEHWECNEGEGLFFFNSLGTCRTVWFVLLRFFLPYILRSAKSTIARGLYVPNEINRGKKTPRVGFSLIRVTFCAVGYLRLGLLCVEPSLLRTMFKLTGFVQRLLKHIVAILVKPSFILVLKDIPKVMVMYHGKEDLHVVCCFLVEVVASRCVGL